MSCNSCSSSNGAPAGCKNNGTCGTDGCNKLTVFDWLENMEPIGEELTSNIFEVRFKNGRKQYYKNSKDLGITVGDLVAVEAERGYDVGFIAYTYPGYDTWDFEELYISFDFYGVYVMYAAGVDNAPDYTEIGYGIDAGPGSFSISYGDYDTKGTNTLVGYDWSVGDFTLGFYYSDFSADVASADEDGAYFTISY